MSFIIHEDNARKWWNKSNHWSDCISLVVQSNSLWMWPIGLLSCLRFILAFRLCSTTLESWLSCADRWLNDKVTCQSCDKCNVKVLLLCIDNVAVKTCKVACLWLLYCICMHTKVSSTVVYWNNSSYAILMYLKSNNVVSSIWPTPMHWPINKIQVRLLLLFTDIYHYIHQRVHSQVYAIIVTNNNNNTHKTRQ